MSAKKTPQKATPPKKLTPPDQRPITTIQAGRLAALAGVPAKGLEGKTIAQLSEILKGIIDPALFLFVEICGQVVQPNPATGVACPSPSPPCLWKTPSATSSATFLGAGPGAGSSPIAVKPRSLRPQRRTSVATSVSGCRASTLSGFARGKVSASAFPLFSGGPPLATCFPKYHRRPQALLPIPLMSSRPSLPRPWKPLQARPQARSRRRLRG